VAYVGGGQTAPEVAKREGIRQRLRDGTQQIIFTSPESLLGPLRLATFQAAKNGLIRRLVIDEAHMVEQWGKEFRTAFQEVAGLRRDLLGIPSVEPFSTVLLTATLTEGTRDTLVTLFGEPGPVITVSAVQLRPEPSYWAVKSASDQERVRCVLEAIDHMPRPLILYVTRPVEAKMWLTRLRQHGYRRLDMMTGLTQTQERVDILRRWQGGQTEIVVATSAFGLGVDQANIRAVIHATVPENVDRFYQEVGRGGRDGVASLSLVVYTEDDVQAARRQNKVKLIGVERGHERWGQMLASAQRLEDGRLRIRVDVRPSLAPGDIDMKNDLNASWNVRTLTLMARAGLLQIGAEEPPKILPLDGHGDDTIATRDFALLRTTRVVRTLRDDTMDKAVWRRDVEPLRRRLAELDRQSHAAMVEVLEGRRCVSNILADTYSVPQVVGRQGVLSAIQVAQACGGCATCRASSLDPWADDIEATPRQWPTARQFIGPSNVVSGGRPVLVSFDTMDRVQWRRFLLWALGQGVRLLVAPVSALKSSWGDLQQAARQGRWVFTCPIDEFRDAMLPTLAKLVFVPQGAVVPRWLRARLDAPSLPSSPEVWVVHEATPDPEKPDQRLRDLVNCTTYQWSEFQRRVGQ